MKSKILTLALILTLGLSASAGEPPVVAAGDGEKVALILAQIIYQSRTGKVEPRTYPVQEEDLNAFLRDQLALQSSAGLEKAQIKLLDENSFITWLTVDMDKLDLGDNSLTGMLLRGLFSGRQTVELEGELDAQGGQGRYTPTRAVLNGTALPLALLNTLLKSVGGRLQPPFDPTEPFQLPYQLQSIRVGAGQATLQTGTGDPRP